MSRVEIDPRPMTGEERSVLEMLLAPGVVGADALRRQAADAVVVARCDCGCPTIHLRVLAVAADRARFDERLWPVEGRVDPTDPGVPGHEILLFLESGKLSSLELVHYGEGPAATWPHAVDIQVAWTPMDREVRPVLPDATPRLRFREMRSDDLNEVAATLAASEGPGGQPRTRVDAERWIEWNTHNYAEHGFGLWVIETHEGKFVGDCGLTVQDVEGEKFVEFGWHVHPGFQRRGYATEAATAVRRMAEKAQLADHLIAIIHPDNLASRRVAENIGLHFERRALAFGQQALIFGTC